MQKVRPPRKPRLAANGEISELRELVKSQALQVEALTKDIARLASGRHDRGWFHKREEELQSAIYDLEAKYRLAQLDPSSAAKQIGYVQMLRRIRDAVRATLPADASVAILSKGDDDLLKLYGRRGLHFPQDRLGRYAGFYPSNDLSAIVQLETIRSRGADFLLIPSMAFWWLDRYAGFRRHLERRYRLLHRDEETCAIYALRERGPWLDFEETIAEGRVRLNREPAVLDWNTGLDLASVFPECIVFSPVENTRALPYPDRTVDLVAVNTNDAAVLAEARRIASEAVINFSGDLACAEWLGDTVSALPSASIIIPVHNGAALTEGCLRSVIETLPASFQGEIIVVDDASTDGTAELLKKWTQADKRIRVIRNRANGGFLKTALRGAKAATGDVLVFLNNDTIALPGWLPPLLRSFRDFPDAGAVGGRLIFPDGSQQEAGGIIFNDGSAAHFGRDDHQLDAALYNFVREVDYCSGAMLATPRALFEELGGFDACYKPAYFEDTDFCFKIRAAGRRVYFQPASALIHLEGASCGTDLTRGVKRHQELNHKKFLKKWSDALARRPSRPAYTDTQAWRALADRGER